MKRNPKFELEDKIVIYENLTRQEFLDLMNKIKHIRILVCSDGTIYAWDGYQKTHEEMMRRLDQKDGLALNLGKYQFSPEDILDNILKIARKFRKRK